jgi:hypothetical protein
VNKAEIQATMDELLLKGLVRIVGLNEAGEPIYEATEAGNSFTDEELRGREL